RQRRALSAELVAIRVNWGRGRAATARPSPLTQHVVEDAAVAVVVGLLRRVDAHAGRELGLARPDRELPGDRVVGTEPGQADDVDHLVTAQAEAGRRLAVG